MAVSKISRLTADATQEFTSDGYTVRYIRFGDMAQVIITRNESLSTTFDQDLTTPLPFGARVRTEVVTVAGFCEIRTTGYIRVKHEAGKGWFDCSAVFIVA